MDDPFEIIKDSSVWYSQDHFRAVNSKSTNICIGIVKKVFLDPRYGQLRYLVEIQNRNDKIDINCQTINKFGGVYNYEDSINRGYTITDGRDNSTYLETRAGDIVLTACLNGETREGIILGGLSHPAKKFSLNLDDGPQYQSEFNGIVTNINKDGEYTITFRGQPTNIAALKNKPTTKIAPATYDTKIGTSFYKFDKTGSFEINDNAVKDLQNMRIDKPKGTITLNSGKVSIRMTKDGEKIDIKSKELTIVSDNTITKTTKRWTVDATQFTKIRSPKIAMGIGNVELLELISQLAQVVIDIATENSIEIHPTGVGPSEVPVNAGQYTNAAGKAGVIKGKVDSIKGSL